MYGWVYRQVLSSVALTSSRPKKPMLVLFPHHRRILKSKVELVRSDGDGLLYSEHYMAAGIRSRRKDVAKEAAFPQWLLPMAVFQGH